MTAQTPIAIVGVSALFAGSNDADGFWRDIVAGRDLMSEVPPSHWSIEDYYDPTPGVPDRTYGRRGSFLGSVDFNPMEFGVPPNILPATDTSQLLALILAKKLMDDAPGAFERVGRDRVGVVLGASTTELTLHMAGRLQQPVWERAMRESGLGDAQIQAISGKVAEMYVPWNENTFPGLLGNVVAGRIANRFDFGGTNCCVDAACASSLAAIEVAVNELCLGHTDLMISGGVDVLNDILMFVCFSQTGALSVTGDCRPFSNRADGTMLAEGLGLFALRRLEDAERDGDPIYAVIRGVGASSDGRAKSIYAPRMEGQAAALRRAYDAAGYAPRTVELVEAHGTATAAGDVAETKALREVFDDGSEERQWCALGSVKSQIGHAKAAAGAAGLFKTVMALHHKVLPPTIKIVEPNPRLEIEQSPFYLNTQARPWIRRAEHPRRAGVSAFGFGGTNFHVTLEEYTGPAPRPPRRRTMPSELVVLSAETPQALGELCRETAKELDGSVGDALAWFARASQSHFDPKLPARLAVVARDAEDLRSQLERLAASPNRAVDDGPITLAFPGQGAEYVGMGADLAMAFDAAREVWDADPELARVVFPPPAFTAEERARQATALSDPAVARRAVAMVSRSMLALLNALALDISDALGVDGGEVVAAAFERTGRAAVHTGQEARAPIFVEVGPSQTMRRRVAELARGAYEYVPLDEPGRHGVDSLWHALGRLSELGVPLNFEALWREYGDVQDPRAQAKPSFSVQLTGSNYGKPQVVAQQPAPEPPPAPIEPQPAAPPLTLLEAFREQQRATIAAYKAEQQALVEAHDRYMQVMAGGAPQPSASGPRSSTFDPAVQTWLGDHRPTFTRPALPMMCIVDEMARAALAQANGIVSEIRNVEVRRWLIVDGPTTVQTIAQPIAAQPGWFAVELSAHGESIATADIACAPTWNAAPAAVAPLGATRAMRDPYVDGWLFHGPAFQLFAGGVLGDRGSCGVLDAARQAVPMGIVHPALLDGAIHFIPYDELQSWDHSIPTDCVAYPHRIDWLTFHGPTPTHGDVRVEVRLDGVQGEGRFPAFRVQYFAGDALWADMRLVEVMFPTGRIGRGTPAERRAFLRDREFVPGLGLSEFQANRTRLAIAELRKNDWFEGTVAAVYDLTGDLREQARQVVLKDHFAQLLRVHPSKVAVASGSDEVFVAGERHAARVEAEGPAALVCFSSRL